MIDGPFPHRNSNGTLLLSVVLAVMILEGWAAGIAAMCSSIR
ncbi:hypothetical protein [Actinomadura rugatobispora]|uniref:Uncharacterized protein n=1 Tax=Actinomadura rugatobispora TaxID=1994 RepID=A0ABW0ZQ38_9ACTN